YSPPKQPRKRCSPMIDFENPTYLKLRPVRDSKLERLVAPLLCPGEEIVQTFQSVRDGVVFTTRRVIAVNVQGVTGMKKAFTILRSEERRVGKEGACEGMRQKSISTGMM